MDNNDIKVQIAKGVSQQKEAEKGAGCVSCLIIVVGIWFFVEYKVTQGWAIGGLFVASIAIGVAVYRTILNKK